MKRHGIASRRLFPGLIRRKAEKIRRQFRPPSLILRASLLTLVPAIIISKESLKTDHRNGTARRKKHRLTPCWKTVPPLKHGPGDCKISSETEHAARPSAVRLNPRCDCRHRIYCYRHLMSSKIAYDVYRGTNDRTLRLATMPGAGLPTHLKRKDWVLMPAGKSPLHSDVARDVGARGYCFFQVVDR
jgi:hypothetical protein